MLKKIVSLMLCMIMLGASLLQAEIQPVDSKIKETSRTQQVVEYVKNNPKKVAAKIAALALAVLIHKKRNTIYKASLTGSELFYENCLKPWLVNHLLTHWAM